MPQPHVVAVGAHPDDCEIFALGTLLQLKAAGARVTFVVMTDGALSLGPPANMELAAKRRIEAERAAEIAGVELEMLGFSDGSLSLQSEALMAVEDVLQRMRPDLVITHHPDDVHRDHRETARLVASRIDPAQKFLYIEPIYGLVAHPNLLVDITPQWEIKEAAICVHETQNAARDILPGIKTWNAFRALQLGGRKTKYAEGFIAPGTPFANPARMLAEAARTRAL